MAVGIPYILLNAVLIGHCLVEVATHPQLLGSWQALLTAKGDPLMLVVLAALAFSKLALGLSGFYSEGKGERWARMNSRT
ncbi:MAG: hypothetical protein KME03_02270 [Aphanocapsa lilacina HA4352-LM1]|nr:hypothetical protein [Aphanocapsa lilacina HA4352-LM1]